jgi:hypothetical protein
MATARRSVKNELCMFCEPGRDHQPITRAKRKAGSKKSKWFSHAQTFVGFE